MRFPALKSSPLSEGTSLDRAARAAAQYAHGRTVAFVDPAPQGLAWLICGAASMTVELMALMIRMAPGGLTVTLTNEANAALTAGES